MGIDPKLAEQWMKRCRANRIGDIQRSLCKVKPVAVKHTHGQLLKACLDVLAAKGVFAWKHQTGALPVGKRFIRFGKLGSPDIIGIMPGGTFLGVEVKVGRDRQSVDQSCFEAHVVRAGGYYFLVRDTVDRLVDQLFPMKDIKP